MIQPSSVTQESANPFDFVSKFGSFAFDNSNKLNNSICTSDDSNGLREGGDVTKDEGVVPINGVESECPKKVLILMSDTGGGHRVSAEAIKATFNEQFGDKYQVFVTDLWTDHMLRPFNQLPRSYNFLVKYDPLWRMTYYASAPRVVHQSNFAATSAFIARLDNFIS
ncbi:hypothetical protein KY290_013835 [Solanum tuberosum]|uniref:Diacylglycerol glucosyltransferase N-terminal domain-containing protein n=1 Tax=Solanum tuberosum TaxID=4113 RepID=A0ABQ7VMW2_SOLTU|nr:hypothetical protein KY289_013953 [Solanum tuberosum]KAH0769854.1 hypothetical protein KY290_013835 [Solanum tuberosum]